MFQTPHTKAKPTRFQDLHSLLYSALCHLAVLIALGLWTTANELRYERIKLLVDTVEGDALTFDETQLLETVELQALAGSAVVPLPVESFEGTFLPSTESTPIELLSEAASEATSTKSLSPGGSGEGDSASGTAVTEFFGIGGYGQAFVYVVDCSDSMNEYGKFDRARYELLRSIEQLSINQRYFVIFFNDVAHPMEGGQLLPATGEQLARTIEWVNYAQAHGGTNPLPALLYALSLRPDAVYFLSDGQFNPSAIRVLRHQNRTNPRVGRKRVPIHTVAFVDRSTQALMRTIARDSGGEHRFVK